MAELPPLPPGFTLDQPQAPSAQSLPPLPPGFTLDSATAQPPKDPRPSGSLYDAVEEPIAVLGSSAIATPIAGLAGLGAMATNKLGLTQADPAEVVRYIQSAMTYEPRTKAGQVVTDIASYPFEKIAQGADYVGGKVTDVTGSPALGAFTNTSLQLAPSLLLKGRGKAGVVEENGRPVSNTAGAPAQPSAARPAPEVPTKAKRQGGLESVSEEVAPDLVLETQTRPNPAQQARVERTASLRAQKFANEKLGIDWRSIPEDVQKTLIGVAEDAKALDKLDAPALARQIQLRQLPVPIDEATAGQLTRDPVQLRNEGNVAATKAGEPIRQVHANQNQKILENLDVLKGRTRGRAETPEQVGMSVQDQALRAKLDLKKKEVSDKYKAAEQAGELQGLVSPAPVVQTLNKAIDKSHYGWVESWLKKNEVQSKTPGGATVTRKMSLKEMEALRQEAVAKAMNGGTEGYYAGKLIEAIDKATEGAGGKLYKEARKARREQAMEFEEQGAVARLVDNKSRTDRSVALEDTWRKTVLGGSLDDIRAVKRSLLTGGDRKTRAAGKQAWRDIKAQTMQFIKDEATKSVALDERGNPSVTPAAMKRAIDKIGSEKMDEIFGPGTARRVNNLLEATRTLKTEPPAIHKGSSTLSNILSFLERGLGRLPVVGDVGSGVIQAGVKLKQMGEGGRIVRESQRNPLAEAERKARRNELLDY